MNDGAVEGFRLSPGQRHVWRSQGQSPRASGTSVGGLVTAGVLALEGCDPANVPAAWKRLQERHEILRTRLEVLPGVALPVQVIGEAELFPVDLSGEAAGMNTVQLSEALLERSANESGPFVAFAVSSEGTPLILLSYPAAILDGASFGVLAEELLLFANGQEPEEEAMQYADLSEWLNELVEGEDSADARAFWNAAGVPADPAWELPSEHRGASGAFRAQHATLDLTHLGAGAIGKAAARAGADSEAFLLGLWQSFLARLSGQEEFLLGVWCDGRGYDELHGAVGLFARDLPFWVALDNGNSSAPDGEMETLPSLAARNRARLDEMGPWQEAFSWEALDRAQGEARDAFAASFEFRSQPASVVASRGAGEIFGLRLIAVTRGDELELEWAWDQGRFASEDVARMAAEFVRLVESACAEPNAPLEKLDLVPEDEQAFLLGPASTVPRTAPESDPIHLRIDEHCKKTPDAVAAVSAAGEELTYGELDRRANALAASLVDRGVGADVRVALSLERSTDLLVGILGILRAGGGYVPIDPGYPTDRVQFLFEDCGAKLLVTNEAVDARLPQGTLERVLLEGLTDLEAPRPVDGASADSLAYVIYTSGSTGQPKGVEITHGNLAHSTSARFEHYPDAPERFLLVSSFAFDSSIVGLFWTLATGGTLVLPGDGDERDARILADLIGRHGVRTTLLLPSLFDLLLEQPEPERLESLRDIIVAGEACPRELVERQRSLVPGARLWNEYGPTENTVWSTVFDCTELAVEGPVPIGRPTPGVRVRVLGRGGLLVPIGAPGELCVGGPGVARGYLDRPDATAERFISDPFEEGARLYRTGDRVRMDADGELHFLGRVDHQVKVRGYRVELEEIEAVLGARSDVAEACVIARDHGGTTQLVAYLVARSESFDVDALLGELRSLLPDYMVPGATVVLPDLPRTPNGKVDRKALPDPADVGGRAGLGSEYVAPRNVLEEAQAALWAEVLGVNEVGVEDDFFELGGHSILAVRLVTRMGENFGVDVGLRQLFDAPTISGLHAVLRKDPASAEPLDRAAELLEELAALSEDEVDQRLDAGA